MGFPGNVLSIELLKGVLEFNRDNTVRRVQCTKKKSMKIFHFLLILLFVITGYRGHTQNPSSETSLSQEILRMDSLLFSVAFNQCDFELYEKIIVEGMEFYDDRTGLNTDIEKEYASFMDKCSRPFSVRRNLVETSVSKLGDFGAVQTGTHIFYNDSKPVQRAKFITIWERREGWWIVKRAVSYEHEDL